jgi:hypothetical protein
MPEKTISLTPPIFGAHHRGRGYAAIRAFWKGAKKKAKEAGCLVRYEVGQMEDLTVDMKCPTKSKLKSLERGLKKTAKAAARLQGTRRHR